MNNHKIGIAMSGGVDSTATALMLREKFQVQGFFMQLAQPDLEEQKARVTELAARLDIPLQIIDLQQEFSTQVVDYFSTSYFGGSTPNPCVICNKEIKFGLFLRAILSAGMQRMATGHYADIRETDGLYSLHTGKDQSKDQSYFLSRLNQTQLARTLFPLGKMTKESIYRYVEAHGFTDFRGRESQDVCFLADNGITSFLQDRLADRDLCGSIVSTSGQILGRHKGLFRYTIGQRKGLGISSPAPLYVVAIDSQSNSLVVGGNDELYRTTVSVKDLHWLSDTPPELSRKYTVRIRYSHRGSTARLVPMGDDRGELIFDEGQRAVTPGQFAVIYNDSELLGSGIIM